MRIAAEVYSAGATVGSYLQRVIQASFTTTPCFGLDVYAIGTICGNSGAHRLVDESRPSCPVALVAGVFHANEKTSRIFVVIVKFRACQQVFYLAIAKQGFGIAVHVLRRHANRP